MQMIFDEYKGKTVIVSGAASGMGLVWVCYAQKDSLKMVRTS